MEGITKEQFQDHVIDQIISFIMIHRSDAYFNNLDYKLDLSQHRKTINDYGYIKTGDNPYDKKVVIYQEDFQPVKDSIVDDFVENVTECFFLGTYDDQGNKLYQEDVDFISESNGGPLWTMDYGDFAVVTEENITAEDGVTIETYGSVDWSVTTNGMGRIMNHSFCNNAGSYGTYYLEINTPAINELSPTPVLDYLSQLISLGLNQTVIDSLKAKDVLDTTIYELLPGIQTRQERIDNFFSEYAALKPPSVPDWDKDEDGNINPNWDLGDPDGINGGTLSDTYSQTYDISDPQNATTGYVTRLVRHTLQSEANSEVKSLQWLRNDINLFLEDIDVIIDPDELDERPDYSDIAEGYIKFRGFNHSIIVRSESEETTGMENYQTEGFTIAMWVRFIDKKSGGTLFNFGNPMGNGSTYGFMLETFAVDENDGFTPSELFQTTSHERFVRLVVRDINGNLRDSHTGGVYDTPIDRLDTTSVGIPQIADKTIGSMGVSQYVEQAFTYTQVPVDRNEWYFVVANFNPTGITETAQSAECNSDANCSVDGTTALKNDPDYWKWNVTPGTPSFYVDNSGVGAQCKVEIISKSDLLRARGYKT